MLSRRLILKLSSLLAGTAAAPAAYSMSTTNIFGGNKMSGQRHIVIFSTGQSNMPDNIPYEWTPASNLQIWNFNANKQPSTTIGTGWRTPDGSGTGPSLSLASEFASANPDALVSLINIYRGGLGIQNWSPVLPAPPEPSYNFREAILNNVPAALASLGVSGIDMFIFGGCEADANSASDPNKRSQLICTDVNEWLFKWLDTQPWFTQKTMSFIRGMSPWAETSPGNGDYRWRRYSRALKAVAAIDPARRAFIDIESMPKSMFDPTGSIPYIHMTGEGYYMSGVRMARQIMTGVHSGPRYESPAYDAGFVNASNCTVVLRSATYKRESDYLVSGRVQATVTALSAGSCSLDISTPVRTYAQPGSAAGSVVSANGDTGVITQSPNKDFLRATFTAKYAGPVVMTFDFSYTCAPSDA